MPNIFWLSIIHERREMAASMSDVLIELQSHPMIASKQVETRPHFIKQDTNSRTEQNIISSSVPARPVPDQPVPPRSIPPRPISPASSLPTVSEYASLQLQPLTGQFEPPHTRQPKRLRVEELLATAQRMHGLSEITRHQLAEADRYIHKGRNAEAVPCLEAAMLGATDEPDLQCLLWRLLGNAHLSLAHYKKASVCHMHQIAFCRELDDFAGMTKAECNLGIAYMKQGLLRLAERCFLQYLENSKILQDTMSVSFAFSNLGVLEKTMALQSYKSIELGHNDSEAQLGMFNSHMRKAISYFEQHLEIVERNIDLEKLGRAYYNLASCYELTKKNNQAIFCHNKRLELVRSTGNREAEICTLCYLGNCLRATGKSEEALDNYQLALELCQASSNQTGEQVALLNLGTTCELMGSISKAIEWHTLCLSISVKTNDLQGQARSFGTLADLYQQTKQVIKAHDCYEKLAKVFEQLGDKQSHVNAANCVLLTKAAVEKQKKILKKQRKANNKRRRKGKPFRGASLDNLLMNDRAMVSGGKGKTQLGTWSPGLKRWYGTGFNNTWGSSVVLENPEALHKDRTGGRMKAKKNLYRVSGIAEELHKHGGNLDSVLKAVRPTFYTLGEFMHSDMEYGGSVNEYDDNTGNEFLSQAHPFRVFGSARHMKDLRQVGHTLLNKSVSDPGAEGAQDEWVEWLQSHGMGHEDLDDSSPPALPPRAQLDEENLSTEGIRVEVQLETQHTSPKNRKRSFQGLSIFNTASQNEAADQPQTTASGGERNFKESKLI